METGHYVKCVGLTPNIDPNISPCPLLAYACQLLAAGALPGRAFPRPRLIFLERANLKAYNIAVTKVSCGFQQ